MDSLRATLRQLREMDAYRGLSMPRARLDFSSNDYLGMANDSEVRESLARDLANGLDLGATGSRLLRGHTEVHERCEAFLAEVFEHESALLFSSGYLANLGVLGALAGEETEFFSDELNHASLIDGMRGTNRHVFRHNDPGHLEGLLRQSGRMRKVIVTESVFSMRGDFAPLAEILSLAANFGAWLVVDEAHATGLYGEGKGRLHEVRAKNVPVIAIHTGGKALGAMGAFVLGCAEARELLINRARTFIFSTALSPIVVRQLELAARIVLERKARREKCLENARWLRARLSLAPVTSPIVPIPIPGNAQALAAAARLQAAGFDVRAIRAPTVSPGQEQLRVSVKSFHTIEELSRLADAIGEIHDG